MLGSLVPWRERSLLPAFPFSRLDPQGGMPALLDRFFGDEPWMPEGFVPQTDLVETEDGFEVTVDLPGMKPDEVQVELHEGALLISGKREEEKEEEGKSFHRIERRHGEFRRMLPLPAAIDEERVEAKFEDGVLKVTVPKVVEAKAKSIEVK